MQYSMWVSQKRSRAGEPPPSTYQMCFFSCTKDTAGFSGCKCTLLDHWASPQGCLQFVLLPDCICAWYYPIPDAGPCTWKTYLNSMRFPSAHLSSPSRSLWIASLPSNLSTRPHSSCNQKTPLPLSLIKMLSSTGPSTDVWETLLITSLHLIIEPLTTTLWVQLSSQFFIHWVVHLSNPFLSSSETRMLCHLKTRYASGQPW